MLVLTLKYLCNLQTCYIIEIYVKRAFLAIFDFLSKLVVWKWIGAQSAIEFNGFGPKTADILYNTVYNTNTHL